MSIVYDANVSIMFRTLVLRRSLLPPPDGRIGAPVLDFDQSDIQDDAA